MERRDVLPNQGNRHAYLGKEKHSFFRMNFYLENKKKEKISIFLFVEKGFYESYLRNNLRE
jgi:hypothetical protein